MAPTVADQPAASAGQVIRRLVMIEDHVMVATALRALLDAEPDLTVVEVATTIAGGLAAVGSHRPDVVVTDLVLPDGLMTDHIAELRARAPRSKLLLVTGAPTEKAVREALDAGVSGFMDKADSASDLVDAVRRVAAGELVASPSVTPLLLAHIGVRDRPHGQLTTRELDVLQRLARGSSTGSIASALSLSTHTVRNHIARAMVKLSAHSRLEAVSEAVRRGLVSPY